MHFGNGQGGPGNGTAFYRFDAGTNLDTFNLSYSAVSNAVLYSTALPPVPEPETYALMLAGLAAVGWVARRRAR
ncbi:PEP-CTERM sorting domain-containing protein [Aquincola sp. J276]|uniref:PEP-CTERM sorting domain-containing protein n=1 Tax=Aquincola sp. J276 TaxID=2898432 RepID=UPI00215191C3|nr:PEP-CTERM sorting domain-containing protein [Aquincola sp. J276]